MRSVAWKHMELKVARALGGERIPGSGTQRVGPLQGDMILPDRRILGECKWRSASPHHKLFRTLPKYKDRITAMLTNVDEELITLSLIDFLSVARIVRD